jgi:hypothetical protein
MWLPAEADSDGADDRVCATGGGVSGFGSSAHPGDRRPQWTHLRKIAPGSHDTPNSWRPER